jgi:hypothetical protein
MLLGELSAKGIGKAVEVREVIAGVEERRAHECRSRAFWARWFARLKLAA